MSDDKKVISKVFVSYIDENNNNINGYVDLLEISINYIKIGTDRNILTIPISRVLKIKENKGLI
jgi:hypothetical protein